mgnify:CR=1 FL=1
MQQLNPGLAKGYALDFGVRPVRGGAGVVDLAAATAVSEGPALRLGTGIRV